MFKTLKSGLIIRLLGLMYISSIAAALGATSQPNIILIITDDQGYGDIGALGNTMIRTPNLDKLAGESVRLTNFHVDPFCSPTRAALMTGKYSSRTGVWEAYGGRSLVARDESMIPKLLANAGYATGMFGKWHLGDNYPFRPEDKGFQHVVYHRGGAVGQTPDYWGNNYFDDTYWVNGTPKKFTGYVTDVWFDQALEFIEKKRNQPFFAYIATNAPHGPFLVDEKYSKPYADQGVTSPMAEFYGMIENIDENMGRLEARLAELGLKENTVVIFMTDNGTNAGVFRPGREVPEGAWPGFAAGMRGRKQSEYEGGHRVPLFIRWPTGGLGQVRDIPILAAHIDVLPTLAEMAGVKVPATFDIDGTSLMPLLRGEMDAWPERTLVVHNQIATGGTPKRWRKSAVMTQRWRLINGKELYDIQADPSQQLDVANDHHEVVATLRKAYNTWWDHINERFDSNVAIPVGERENPARITAQDWHMVTTNYVFLQHASVIKNNPVANGHWTIDVAEPGAYEIELYQWDKPAKKILDATTARIQIGDMIADTEVPAGSTSVVFRVELPKGPAKMMTWLRAADGTERGALYAYVKRL